uniref:PE family protein n=1 Tax=Steinernema glaseri TaxID=37863 RepID=A0A1I7ZPH7_9BILA
MSAGFAGAGAAGVTLGNGTEGDLQAHAGALSSAYQMDSGAHNAILSLATGGAGFSGFSGAPSTDAGTSDFAPVNEAAGGSAGFAGTGAFSLGNGTEGNLQAHAAALASTYQLDSGSHNAALGVATS